MQVGNAKLETLRFFGTLHFWPLTISSMKPVLDDVKNAVSFNSFSFAVSSELIPKPRVKFTDRIDNDIKPFTLKYSSIYNELIELAEEINASR